MVTFKEEFERHFVSIKFTIEKEENGQLHYLDVHIKKKIKYNTTQKHQSLKDNEHSADIV